METDVIGTQEASVGELLKMHRRALAGGVLGNVALGLLFLGLQQVSAAWSASICLAGYAAIVGWVLWPWIRFRRARLGAFAMAAVLAFALPHGLAWVLHNEMEQPATKRDLIEVQAERKAIVVFHVDSVKIDNTEELFWEIGRPFRLNLFSTNQGQEAAENIDWFASMETIRNSQHMTEDLADLQRAFASKNHDELLERVQSDVGTDLVASPGLPWRQRENVWGTVTLNGDEPLSLTDIRAVQDGNRIVYILVSAIYRDPRGIHRQQLCRWLSPSGRRDRFVPVWHHCGENGAEVID